MGNSYPRQHSLSAYKEAMISLEKQPRQTHGTRLAEPESYSQIVKHKRGGHQRMAVEKVGETYRCNVCGNEVVVTEVGGGTLVCCGEDMEKIAG